MRAPMAGSAAGDVGIRASSALAPHRDLGLTDAEYDADLRADGARAERARAGGVLADVVGALRLQALEEAAAQAAHRGPAPADGAGRERRRVDVGDGLAIAFKVESHNHPSAVEPFQGAATGVGGILRDIFAVGARPIAVLDSLRFGELDSPRSRYLFDWAVAGIGHYGNSIGVPTVGGEIYFEAAYEQNCLVNAMCAGPRAARPADQQRGRGRRQPPRPARRADRPRRDRRRLGARQRRAAARTTLQAADRPDRRPVRGVEARRVLPRAARARPARLAPGPRRRRPHVRVVGDGLQGRGRARHRRRPGAAARGRHGAVRDHDLGVAGAHALRGRAGAARRGARGLRALGRARRPRSARSPTRAGCGSSTATSWSATCRSTALVDDCPLYDLEPEQPSRADLPGAAGARLAPRGARRGDAARAAQRAARSPRKPPALSSSTTAIVGSRTVRAPRARPTPRCCTSGRTTAAAGAIAVSIDGNGRRSPATRTRGTIEAVLECAAQPRLRRRASRSA